MNLDSLHIEVEILDPGVQKFFWNGKTNSVVLLFENNTATVMQFIDKNKLWKEIQASTLSWAQVMTMTKKWVHQGIYSLWGENDANV